MLKLTFTVSFFGHRRLDDLNHIDERLMPLLQQLIRDKNYVVFQVGRNGEFDEYVASVIKRARREYGVDNNELTLIRPYEVADMDDYWNYYDSVLIPDCLEGVHPKSAITQRNRWMVEEADLVVVNVERASGGAYQAKRYAEKLHIPVVNLAEEGMVGRY